MKENQKLTQNKYKSYKINKYVVISDGGPGKSKESLIFSHNSKTKGRETFSRTYLFFPAHLTFLFLIFHNWKTGKPLYRFSRMVENI